jgi:hypothetical protein
MTEEKIHLCKIGQRVRINEEEDPPIHVGKMATIESIEAGDEPICNIKVDRTKEILSLPQHYLTSLVTKPSTILANDLFLPWDMDNPDLRFKMFIDNRWISGRIMEALLYYDHIIIPTVDFSIIVPLVHWLGAGLFKDLLVSEAISFVRYTGGLAYTGNGVGLVLFVLLPGEKPDTWWMKATRCSPQEAVILMLNNRLKGLNDKGIELLAQLVELCTIDTELPQFQQKVADETYRDVLGSGVLQKELSITSKNMTQLPGLNANQMRVFSRLGKTAVKNDEIDITLRLAMLNLETYLAEEAEARDMVTDRGFCKLLEVKAQRYTGGSIAKNSFAHLITIEKIPDLITAIKDEEINLLDIWNFRNSRYACQFRQWFDKEGPKNPDKMFQEYIDLIKSGNKLTSGKYKLIRFIILQIIGASLIPVSSGISFITSMGLSAIDNFLLDNIRIGFNPRYFIDDYRHKFFEEK